MRLYKYALLLFCLLSSPFLIAQVEHAPEKNEGKGPFPQLIIRGITLIDGTGSPPIGPMDIVIEGDRIIDIVQAGYPGIELDPNRKPVIQENGYELDAAGMYALPGFVDMHGHIGGMSQGANAEYVYKLWMAHGITTIREPGSFNGLDWVLEEKANSLVNKITAPRIFAYTGFGMGAEEPIKNATEARAWVRKNVIAGADGIKFFGAAPDVMAAALDENKKARLRSTCHHAQLDVARWNVLHSARSGLTSMEHWYGLPEALFDDQTVQDYPVDYNYLDEQDRFSEAGRLWQQAAPPYSDHWNAVMDELIAMDFTLDPTFNIYEASRDLHRTRRLEWHETYTMPKLWMFFQPSKISHGSYWHYWGSEEEVDWRENYRLWMTFVNEY